MQLAEDDVRQMRVSLAGLAKLVCLQLGGLTPPTVLYDDRLYDLGLVLSTGWARRTFVARGMLWPDSKDLMSRLSSASGSTRPLVLVPASPGPPPDQMLDVLPLLGSLSLNDAGFGLSLPDRLQSASRPSGSYSFQRLGEGWRIVFEGTETFIADAVGMPFLRTLLANPRKEFTASKLTQVVSGLPAQGPVSEPEAQLTVSDGGDAGEVIDIKARDAYRARARELQALLEDAAEVGNEEALAAIRDELEAIEEQLAGGINLRGRPRRARATSEKARVRVTKAISAAIVKIGIHLPALSAHLAEAISTGAACEYRPQAEIRWET